MNKNFWVLLLAIFVILWNSSLWAETVRLFAKPDTLHEDTDGDGFPDGWEIYGADWEPDGIVDVDLPGMGANFLRKDIFVEIDWMAGDPTSPCVCVSCNFCPACGVESDDPDWHKPSEEAIALIVEAFASAPVSNPDGSTGITLHVDYGQGGLFTGGNSVPHDDDLSPVWDEFDAIKATNFVESRQQIFHYCIFAHQHSGCSSSGKSRGIPGSDIVVTFGGWSHNPGTLEQQAGTFMHELGHNLGVAAWRR